MDPKDLKLLKNIILLENVFQEKNLNLYENFKEIGLDELSDKIIDVYFINKQILTDSMKSLNSESVDIIFGEFFQKKDESKTLEILNDLDLINQFRLIRRFVELSRTPEDKAFVKKIVERTEFFKILIRKKMDPKDLKLLKNI
ncbi:MAG: hypothetical protein UR14_C0006G0001, partial [candidate division TM6 bacterium GW2011_GWE2_31_21]